MQASTFLILLACIFCLSAAFRPHGIRSRVGNPTRIMLSSKSVFDIAEDEDVETFRRIAKNYLTAKFRDCRGENCRDVCDRKEVEALLKTILPPVTPSEFEAEIGILSKKLGKGDLVDVSKFLDAALDNSYWAEAGPLVVKELIFLDCIHEYYDEKRAMLDDEDYNDLKEMLTWEGSAVAAMNGKEAKFVASVAAFRRGQSMLNDKDYESLKSQLQAEGSWVVKRAQDPLEKMGLKTFLGYLHRSL
jgi:hypothetical protein